PIPTAKSYSDNSDPLSWASTGVRPAYARAVRYRLAVAYDADSSSPMEISGALGDECDLIWVVDGGEPLGAMARMLPRLGSVVDCAGLDADGALAVVRQARPDGILAFTDSKLA